MGGCCKIRGRINPGDAGWNRHNAFTPIYRGSLMARKPTEKQRKFAQDVADGANLTQAYRQNYDTSGSSANTTRVNAHRLANNPNVVPTIDALKAQNERGLLRSVGNRRRWILERLLAEAESLESTPASRVKSLELLAKMAGLFDSEQDRSEKRQNATESELVSELNQRLGEIINKPIVISAGDDGTPTELLEGLDDDPTPL